MPFQELGYVELVVLIASLALLEHIMRDSVVNQNLRRPPMKHLLQLEKLEDQRARESSREPTERMALLA